MSGISRVFKDVFIVSAKRTAFGTFGGKLRNVPPVELMEKACKGALIGANVDPGKIDSVIFGQVILSSSSDLYMPRTVGLRCGTPLTTPGLMVQRLAASGYEAVLQGANELTSCEGTLALVGGVENMSMAPLTIPNGRFDGPFWANRQIEDFLWNGFTDPYANITMGMTAENIGEKYGIIRTECDEYAYQSHMRWKSAQQAGVFKDEIAPIEIKGSSGMKTFDVDEHPRPNTTVEHLAKLSPVFKHGGMLTAGNSSGMNDGAVALVLANEISMNKYDLKPLARLVSYGIAGCDAELMGYGPVPASKLALKAAGKGITDMEMIEINEAFSSQILAVQKILQLDPAITNMHGGGISIGHPISATGARLIGHVAHYLRYACAFIFKCIEFHGFYSLVLNKRDVLWRDVVPSVRPFVPPSNFVRPTTFTTLKMLMPNLVEIIIST